MKKRPTPTPAPFKSVFPGIRPASLPRPAVQRVSLFQKATNK